MFYGSEQPSNVLGYNLDLNQEIKHLKEEKNAVILAHYYQNSDIQDVADFIGDSLALSQQAANTNASIIVFAGVHFMAETAKILCPDKKVLIPDLEAGCSLSDDCPPEAFKEFRLKHPDHVAVTYINCSAAVKAYSDIICTSSNAVHIVNSLPKDQKIIFAPDKNLGRYVMKMSGRDMLLWDGACMVHELFSQKKIEDLLLAHPDAELIAHPECEEPVLKMAHFIGSTSALLSYTKKGNTNKYIVATESGILYQMINASPQKIFIPAPPIGNCACNDCPYMKKNTLEKLYLCLKNETPAIDVPETIRIPAEQSIRRMLELSVGL
jgi:quinolinate synthase